MDSASFPSVKLDPVAPPEMSALAAPEKPSTIKEYIPASQDAYGHFEIDEQSAQVIAIVSKLPVAVQSAMEQEAIAPQTPPVEATCEKTAPANLLEFCGLQQQPFDVIVTDMRMPAMSGAQLMEEVKRRFPQCFRIVLSGQADQESIMRAVDPAHQYLAKPCTRTNSKNDWRARLPSMDY